jgi:insulysin
MKKLLALILLTTHTLTSVTEIKDEIHLPILTPDLSERKTLKLRLDNNLEAYIISDPSVDKSGAALAVQVGSFNDPVEYPGLAHFTEHMLFLGTKKYPKEAEYQSFISTHGGQANAFTANDTTGYLFSIDSRYFEEALDRFADFFKEPIFNPSGVAREMQAIDQEYAKNLQSDMIKQYSVQKDLAHPSHPFKNFSMGNSKTLSSVSREVLQKFYQDHYSANLMHLIVISPLPLEQLKSLVVQDFSGIENKNKTPLTLTTRATNIDQQIVYIEPLRDLRTLDIIWELPQSFVAMKNSRPERLICYVLGHEGEKSLLAQLKREDLAESLSCGILPLSNAQAEFYVDIHLTEKGLKQRDSVVERVFQAIAHLKAKALPPYLFQNMQDVEKLRYQYQPKEDVFTFLMKQILTISGESIETFPIQTAITQTFDPQSIKALLATLTPQNAHIELLAKPKHFPIKLDKMEKWTETKYNIEPLPKDKIASWSKVSPHFQIDLPEENTYIPRSFNLFASQTNPLPPHPKQIYQSGKGSIYFAQDQKYQMPQIYWAFEIKTPKIMIGDPNSIVLGDLYIKMLCDALNHISYQALMADLHYALQRTANGISITLAGYNDKAENLFDEILRQLAPKTILESKFKIYKESLLQHHGKREG